MTATAPPASDLQPWTGRHDWDWKHGYHYGNGDVRVRCRRCLVMGRGSSRPDCPGRAVTVPREIPGTVLIDGIRKFGAVDSDGNRVWKVVPLSGKSIDARISDHADADLAANDEARDSSGNLGST